MVDIAGAAVSATTAQLGVNVVNIGNAASAGVAGYVGLDWGHITAPTTTVALTGTTIATSQVVASVTGAVGSVTGAVGSVTGSVGGSVGSLGATAQANVKTQMVAALATDTYPEPAGVPSATASLAEKIGWNTSLGRNKVKQTATTQTLRNAADAGDIATAAVSDTAGTFTRGPWT